MDIDYLKHCKFKNGFTLVELLAVLVILGVILSITTIKIVGVLKENRRKGFEISVNNYVRSASLEKFSHVGIKTYQIVNGEQSVDVNYNGDISSWNGTIQIYNTNIYRLSIYNDEFCAISSFYDKSILVFDGNCEAVEYTENNPVVASLEAKKSIAQTAVISGKWSNESLVISIAGLSPIDVDTINYCIDTTNTCSPSVEYTEPFTHDTEGIRYIRYQVNTIVETQSAVETFTAKIDTTTPSLLIAATKVTSGTLVSSGVSSKENLSIELIPTSLSGSTIKYCIDTTNVCSPSTTYSTPFIHSTSGTRYIRYKITNNAGTSSAISSYTAIINKTTTTKKPLSSCSCSGSPSANPYNYYCTQNGWQPSAGSGTCGLSPNICSSSSRTCNCWCYGTQ